LKGCLACIIFLLLCHIAAAQTCNVINSIPSTPPTGQPDTLISATSPYYCTQNARVYSAYNINGGGTYTTLPLSDALFTNSGGLNYCGLWGTGNPQTIGFSVCVNIPEDKSYYIGFASDNSGSVTIDGVTVLENIGYSFWGMYKITLTKGVHFVGFSVVNFDVSTPASIGFEIYDNTEQQMINAVNYYELDVIYSTRNELGHLAQAGDASATYSCPLNYIPDYCSTTSSVPVCSQFVPINLDITDPAPACLSTGVDLTSPQITAGSPTSLTYSYWMDALATIPLANPAKITKSGTYYIMGSSNYCNLIKPVTVTVEFKTSVVESTICLGSSYLGYGASGAYIDTLIAANGCDSLRTLNLTVTAMFTKTLTVNICNGDSYMGHSKSGVYMDTVATASGCDSVITTNLVVGPIVNLGPGRQLCLGDSILLNPGAFSHYLWQDGSTAPTYKVVAGGLYWVTVTDANGCMGTDTVAIKEIRCSAPTIPNTFTPNGDGINDTWIIDGLQNFPKCTVFVYSRWGQLVFSSIGYGKAFDGTYKGKRLATGTYYYIINLNDNSPPISGYVVIIR
jgi:gliding motility-associated-like protein